MVCGLADPDEVPEKAVGSPLTVPFWFFGGVNRIITPPQMRSSFPGPWPMSGLSF
jgi:hypothetical protein